MITLLKRVTEEEGPNGELILENPLLWMLWLHQVVKDGAEGADVGKEEEVMVNKVRPALSGFHLGSDESWRQLNRQGHLQLEILGKTVGCHMPQGPGFQSSQGGKGNPRSFCSNQRFGQQLAW